MLRIPLGFRPTSLNLLSTFAAHAMAEQEQDALDEVVAATPPEFGSGKLASRDLETFEQEVRLCTRVRTCALACVDSLCACVYAG
jgi:hypothetical protein